MKNKLLGSSEDLQSFIVEMDRKYGYPNNKAARYSTVMPLSGDVHYCTAFESDTGEIDSGSGMTLYEIGDAWGLVRLSNTEFQALKETPVDLPDSGWLKADILAYMDMCGIDYPSGATKQELIDIINSQ